MLSRLLAKEDLVGLDIGSSSIKIVHAEPTKQGLKVSWVATCPTPRDSVKEGIVLNVPEVTAAIQFALNSAGIKSTSAVAAIAGPGVIVRQVEFPRMSEEVLRKSIHFEASKYISASLDDSIVEFEIIGPVGADQMSVRLVAAPRAMIESRVSVLEKAGLDPLAIDIEAFATFRSLVQHNPDQGLSETTAALLDIGASHTEINLVHDGDLKLTRTISIAGDSLSGAIRNATGCTEEEAEQAKHSLDLSELTGSPSDTAVNQSLKVVQSLVDELVREIRRSINYYQSQLPDGSTETTVEKILLTGGTTRLKGLVPYLKSRLNIDVGIGSPAFGSVIEIASSSCTITEEEAPLLAVAFGLVAKEVSASVRLPKAA